MVLGLVRGILVKCITKKSQKIMLDISMGTNILIVLFLAMAREAYAVMLAFLLLVVKGVLLWKCMKSATE